MGEWERCRMGKNIMDDDKKMEEFWECVGFGAHKVPIRDHWSQKEREARSKAMFAQALSHGNVIAMVGNGLSRSIGYPSWDEFAEDLLKKTIQFCRNNSQSDKRLDWLLKTKRDLYPNSNVSTKKLKKDLIRNSKEILSERRFEVAKMIIENGNLSAVSSTTKMYIISNCQKILSEKNGDDFENFLYKNIGNLDSINREYLNPFRQLVKLPIFRFITTNYDTEIEQALIDERRVEVSKFGIGSGNQHKNQLSFTQAPAFLEQHARFFLTREKSNRNMVFHVHGRWDIPDSIVAGEDDYKKWYLSNEDGSGEILTQKIDLIISSNPLLFIGYSFGDEDLMGILRRITATDPERKSTRPLFALMDDSDPSKAAMLYDRYGLNVITFEKPSKPSYYKDVYYSALEELGLHTQKIHKLWLSTPKCYQIPTIVPEENCWEILNPIDCQDYPKNSGFISDSSDYILKGLNERFVGKDSALYAITGSEDSCKTLIVQDIIKKAKEDGKFEKIFYWNAHYTDNFLALFDHLTVFFTGDNKTEPNPSLAFLGWLGSQNALVVLDGIERLFENDYHDYSPFYDRLRHLTDAIARIENHCSFIFVGRRIPKDLSEKCKLHFRTKPIDLTQVKSMILGGKISSNLRDDMAKTVYACGQGSYYGMQLAYSLSFFRTTIQGLENKKPIDFLNDLHLRQAVLPPRERIWMIYKETLSILDEKFKNENHISVASNFIRKIGLILIPIDKNSLKIICDQTLKNNEFEKLLSCLLKLGMILEVRTSKRKGSRYSLRPSLREYLYGTGDIRTQRAVPSLGLGGVSSALPPVYPHKKDESRMIGLFEEFRSSAINTQSIESIRIMFSLVRSRMNATGGAQSPKFREYVSYALQILALCKMSENCSHPHSMSDLLSSKGILFAADIAWMYNDTGFALLLEGYKHDAIELWEMGLNLSRIFEESHPSQYQYTMKFMISLGLACIDIGRIKTAESFIYGAMKINAATRDKMLEGKMFSCLGMIEQLRANYQLSLDYYQKSLEIFKNQFCNNRGQSIVYRYMSTLYLKQNKLDDARSSTLSL